MPRPLGAWRINVPRKLVHVHTALAVIPVVGDEQILSAVAIDVDVLQIEHSTDRAVNHSGLHCSARAGIMLRAVL